MASTNSTRASARVPSRRHIVVGRKTGTGPLTLIVDRHEAAARVVAEFAGLAAADLRDSQLDAISRARTTLTDTCTELARSGHLHLIDRTVPVPAIAREVLRLRTTMRAAGYNPDQPHKVEALATIVGIDTRRLADVLVGRAPYGQHIPTGRLTQALSAASAA
jgi:hypothetical protein